MMMSGWIKENHQSTQGMQTFKSISHKCSKQFFRSISNTLMEISSIIAASTSKLQSMSYESSETYLYQLTIIVHFKENNRISLIKRCSIHPAPLCHRMALPPSNQGIYPIVAGNLVRKSKWYILA
jgi:hypothetical protein